MTTKGSRSKDVVSVVTRKKTVYRLWIAFDRKNKRIVAEGKTMNQVHKKAVKLGFPDAVITEKRLPSATLVV